METGKNCILYNGEEHGTSRKIKYTIQAPFREQDAFDLGPELNFKIN
jgi:hypothetical protein